MTLEEAEGWLDNTEEIERQFKCIIDMSIFFDDEWLKRKKKELFNQLLEHGWKYSDCIIFEERGDARSNFNSDRYINLLMERRGVVGEKVGLGFGV